MASESKRVVVLVLPGGTDFSYRPFSRTQGSALRMYPFTWSARTLVADSIVRQAQYRVVGWNGGQASPLWYARAQLERLERENPGLPVVLVGHSMGGRVAAHLASDPRVVGVCALAPWWQFADWREINPNARVLALHGTADRITFPERTEKGIAELAAKGMDATYVPIAGGRHPMLDHVGEWERATVNFIRSFIPLASADTYGADT